MISLSRVRRGIGFGLVAAALRELGLPLACRRGLGDGRPFGATMDWEGSKRS